MQPTSTTPHLGASTVLGDAIALPLPPNGNPANARCPIDLRADSWPGGRRIDLVWSNPDDVRWVLIRRARSASPPVPNAPSEILYFGGPIDHFVDGIKVGETFGYPGGKQAPPVLEAGLPATGEALDEETIYHYAVFLSAAVDPPGVRDFGDARACNHVAALSIPDYTAREGEWVYLRHIPAEARKRDAEEAAVSGREVGYLRSYCRFVQGGLDLARGVSSVPMMIGNPEITPAGFLGLARRHSDILANWFRLFDLPPERYSLDLDVLRRVSLVAARLAQLKGNCTGLCELVKAVTLWDCECMSTASGPCNPKTLKTWSGSLRKVVSYPRSLVDLTVPGKFVLPAPVLEDGRYDGGTLWSWTWSYHLLGTNTADTVNIRSSEIVSCEDVLDVTLVEPGPDPDTYVLTVTRVFPSSPPEINDQEWVGGTLLSNNNLPCQVLSSSHPGTVNVLSPLGAPATGTAAVASSFILGATFADRDPEFLVTIRSPCASTLWHPNKQSGNHKLYSAGLLLGLEAKPGDLVLPVSTSWATLARGFVTAVSSETITDTTTNFGPAGSLVGTLLCPNVLSPVVYEVVDNTPTSITVAPPSGIFVNEVTAVGSNYALFDRAQARLFDAAHRLARYYVPSGSKVIITFPTE